MHGEKDVGRTSEDEGMEWVRLLHCSWGMKSCQIWIHRWATSSPTGVRPKPKGDATPCVLVQSNLHLYTQNICQNIFAFNIFALSNIHYCPKSIVPSRQVGEENNSGIRAEVAAC